MSCKKLGHDRNSSSYRHRGSANRFRAVTISREADLGTRTILRGSRMAASENVEGGLVSFPRTALGRSRQLSWLGLLDFAKPAPCAFPPFTTGAGKGWKPPFVSDTAFEIPKGAAVGNSQGTTDTACSVRRRFGCSMGAFCFEAKASRVPREPTTGPDAGNPGLSGPRDFVSIYLIIIRVLM